eukprot:GFUD01042710.1.p1 GENE.GFUD01042710.1~~GFUD01042710.1.p1  ORF type:complete len:176 (+),score=67.70 GFUD01042710.1:55-582(+)
MSTTVKDLPKDLLIADGLKGELLKEHKLKPTEATEKNLLPTAEDVQQEKTHQNILTGIAGFKSDSLKPTETMEKIVLPGEDDIKTEKTIQGVLQAELARDSSLSAVSDFEWVNLKKAETADKNSVPSTESITQEAEHIKLKDGIEIIDKSKLSHKDTMEKNILPTKEVIALEKSQ